MTNQKKLAASIALAGALLPTGIPTLAQSADNDTKHSFSPGEEWLDTKGKPIQAHGGSVIQVGDAFYWYGENKEFTTGDMKVYTWGIRCYKSMDLYNWEDIGLIVPPNLSDVSDPLHPGRFNDRPHILYNAQTRKFVCWIKVLDEPYQTRTVLISESITGPYEIASKGVRPLGMSAGDFDLAVNLDDAKAYMYFERVHSEMICADLTENYTGFTGYYSTHFPRPGPPSVREGLAHFTRHGRQYVISSGTTGYFPNPSEVAIADTFHGPFTLLGDLHPADKSRTSFNSQISCVFKHPQKKDLYIAIADRWMGPLAGPEFESGEMSRIAESAFRKRFSHPPEPLTESEARFFGKHGLMDTNTSKSRYVWLPIRFNGDRPYIDWRSEWSLDEFE